MKIKSLKPTYFWGAVVLPLAFTERRSEAEIMDSFQNDVPGRFGEFWSGIHYLFKGYASL